MLWLDPELTTAQRPSAKPPLLAKLCAWEPQRTAKPESREI